MEQKVQSKKAAKMVADGEAKALKTMEGKLQEKEVKVTAKQKKRRLLNSSIVQRGSPRWSGSRRMGV